MPYGGLDHLHYYIFNWVILYIKYMGIGTEIIWSNNWNYNDAKCLGIIWRNQKIVLGMKEGDVAAGAKAGLASRTNTLFQYSTNVYGLFSSWW